ncbi:MAG TPA: M56 family metallopeptidase [Terriglobales bacterium]|nr:M56 family metallopeptidase [Terriglobales bacterium]
MTAPFDLHPLLHIQTIAQLSAARIVDSLLAGAFIVLVAGAALRLRRQTSGTRFAVWFSALLAIAAAPLSSGLLHSFGWSQRATLSAAVTHPAITLPASWALYLFAAWALIATLSLSRVLVSLRHLRALRQHCVPVDSAQLDAVVRATLHRESSRRPVALCTSNQVHVPTAIGFFQPAVIVPSWLLADLSPAELNQILLHELAHLRRRDDWTNLIQKIVKALFFFHPAVWWIEKKISLEREMACDDAVLAATSEPRAYAECLTHLAERTLVRRSLVRQGIALAQAALGRVRHTSLRVAQILNPNRPHATKSAWKPALSLTAVLAVGALVLASKEPQLVAFQNAPIVPTASSAGPRSAALGSAGVPPAIASAYGARTPLSPIPASFVLPETSRLKNFPRHRRTPHVVNKFTTNKTAPVAPPRIEASNNVPDRVTDRATDNAASSTIEGAFIVESQIASSGANPSSLHSGLVNPSLVHPGLVHLASTTSASTPVSTETIFLFVETNQSGRPIYQIHMWRLTVLPAAIPAASKATPRKET